jgi:hypothetical protein
MRAVYLALIFALASSPASAQQPSRPLLVGTYVGASFSTPKDPRAPRLGACALLPLIGPIDLYPAVEIFPDVGSWQGLLSLRLQPFGTHGAASIWYVGAGIALSDQATRKALVTGVQWPPAGLRPFLELRFLGDIEEANPELDIVAGVSVRLR